MHRLYSRQSAFIKQAVFAAQRNIYRNVERISPAITGGAAVEKKAAASGQEKLAEKNLLNGVPIDVSPAKSKEQNAEQTLREAEKKVMEKFGGKIYTTPKLPGEQEKGYRGQVYINVPKENSIPKDKNGKPKPPKYLYCFHGNQDSLDIDTAKIMKQVEEMRARGENVILVMPQDKDGSWTDFDGKETFRDIATLAESVTQNREISSEKPEITIASFNNGHKGVAKVLRSLRVAGATDLVARNLYNRIKHLSLLDSTATESEEFAYWAKNKKQTAYPSHIDAGMTSNESFQLPAQDEKAEPSESVLQAPAVVNTEPVKSEFQAPEIVTEDIERLSDQRVFVIGDSLSDGFVPKLRGIKAVHVHPEGKNTSQGQSTTEMLSTLRHKLLHNDVADATLVVVGGTNDIFMRESLPVICHNLAEIYRLAKSKGMKVIAGTIPPLAGSVYSAHWARQYSEPVAAYESALIARWQAVNKWIVDQKEIDKVIEFDKILEDPDRPGCLKKEAKSKDGVHLGNYALMAEPLAVQLPQSDSKLAEPLAVQLPQSDSHDDGGRARDINPALTQVQRSMAVDRTRVSGPWRPAPTTKEIVALALQKQHEFMGKVPIGTNLEIEHNGQKYQLRVRKHDYQVATGNRGDFYAVEVWEPNPDYKMDTKQQNKSNKTETV